MIRVSLFLSGRLVTKATFDTVQVTLGRDPSCDVVIDNLGVSRQHARIFHEGDVWTVEDLGSSNGIHFNGSRARRQTLLADDEFGIGKYTVKFEVLAGEPVAAATAAVAEASPLSSISSPLCDDHGDLTFALDRGDLEKILEKARMPQSTDTRAPRLTRIKPAKPIMIVPLTRGHYMAGTARGSDIRLKGWFTPRRAAMFVQEGGRDMVISLTDRSRVKVNRKRVDSQALADGDIVQIGRNRFIYTM